MMWTLLGLLCMCLAAAAQSEGDTDLEFVFLVHRHGDRTPVNITLMFSTEPEEITKAVEQRYGWGQLTDIGKMRSYRLGEFIKSRYSTLISPHFNQSEVFIRSTDSTRAKMSILSALAAIYPPTTPSWSPMVNWEPVPYTTVQAIYDFNLGTLNCPEFGKIYYDLFMTSVPSMAEYNDLLTTLSPLVNFDLVSYPSQMYGVYDLYASLLSLGVPFNPVILDAFPQIEEIAGKAIDHIFGNDQYIALQAGSFLEEFFEYADKIVQGKNTPRLRIYSAHDFNVFSLQAVSQVTERQGAPKYSSLYALELRKVRATGEYVVMPVYLPAPGEELKHLEIKDCGAQCAYEQFKDVTKDYVLDVKTWRTQCGWSEDIEIDETMI